MIKEIKFTDKAIKQINNLLSQKDPGSFFRIAIKGGGCSGFQYEFTFDKSKQADDLNYQNILIDKASADLLKGSEIADIWASNEPKLVKSILLLKLFNPINLLTVERSSTGPLCFNNPSKVSNVKLRPLNLINWYYISNISVVIWLKKLNLQIKL